MEQNFIIAGFGGQGVLFTGKILANAFMLAGKNVTWYPCYGAEMRGGTVNCEIVISDEEVSSVHKENADFIRLCPVSTGKNLRQERFELILRFFAYLNNYQNFVHKVNGFLNDFLIDNMETFNEEQYQMEFVGMLAFVDANFEFGFAKTQNASTTPRVRFEAISVGVALALREQPDLTVDNVDWINSEEFKHLTTSDASNNQNKLIGRIEYVRDILLGKLND